MDNNQSSYKNDDLTDGQRAQVTQRKDRALMIRQSRLTVHPYANRDVSVEKAGIKIGAMRIRDPFGSFLQQAKPEKAEASSTTVEEEPPIFVPNKYICDTCDERFGKSWLYETFDVKVCDNCKDSDTYKLITKTEAMSMYLLKDCDFDKREPPLRFVVKKNPHNVRWGDMKLYLKLQVEQRSVDVWGDKKKIAHEMELREERRLVAKNKKYNRKMKELRMNVRSSMYDRTSTSSHTHQFSEDTYNETDDTYTHACITCGYEETFEKM